MPTVSRVNPRPERYIPPFENGARMDQKTFHELYLQTPDGFKAELIGGIVYVASPVSGFHSVPNSVTGTWLGVYAADTLGTQACTDSSAILSQESEPQPDQCVRITEQAVVSRYGTLSDISSGRRNWLSGFRTPPQGLTCTRS